MSEIANWLRGLGLEKYASAFAEAEIDFETLPELEEDDFKELGLPLGPRRKIRGAIKRLGATPAAPVGVPAEAGQPAPEESDAAPAPDAERRHLTVMFVDLVGSTELAARIDAEDMRNVITDYQNTVAGIVGRYEGFVAKFMGDGVLCYFGWPRANEDDAERAVRAGLSIIETVMKTRAPDGAPLATRIGIATGVVIVGDLIGSGATQEAAVIGETPNLAARLQGIAQPNRLVLPKETQHLLGSAYKLTSIGRQELKGVGVPVEAFVVEGEAVQESRFAARHSGALAPIVGRDREIELMLEHWALARSGQGQVLVVSGEAGIGKSRITRAVIDGAATNDHVRMTYQCSPYHADSAFYPVIQQMSFAAGFRPTDSVDMRLDRLEALLGADNETLRLIAPLMGLDGTERYGALELTPAQQRAQTMRVLTDLLLHQARDKPVLLVYEDLHWVDPTSLELLELLLDAIADHPIMILATARPSFDYGFGGHPIVTRLALNRLGKDQIGAIVSKLTGGKALPDEIMEIIAQRTDGVPLFVEELTKTILESGALKEDGDRLVLDGPLSTIAIPTSLHDSLMARLDRLQPIKEVAQTAACIGREFSHKLLVQVSLLPETELTTALEGLINAELIYRRGVPPEATYLFKHALVRDAAYESLLKEKRRAIHSRVLASLENDNDIAPEVLAVHAEEAGLIDRAIDLWESAGKAAILRPAYDEGIAHIGRAIDLVDTRINDGDKEAIERAMSLQVQRGMAYLTRLGHGADETVSAFELAIRLADEIGETPMRYSILYGLWIGKGVRGEHQEARLRAETLIEQAAHSSETAPLVVAHRVAGTTYGFMGEFARALEHLDIALKHYDPIEHEGLADRFGQDIGVSVNTFQALNRLATGQCLSARNHSEEAVRIARQTAHVQTVCYALSIRSLFYLLVGDTETANRCMTEVQPIIAEHNLVMWQNFGSMIMEVLAARSGDRDSIRRYLKADEDLIATKVRMFVPQLRVVAAFSAVEMGLLDEAAALAGMATDLIVQTGETYALAELHRAMARIAYAGNDIAEAEKQLMKALEIARKQGARLWELRAAIDLAQIMENQDGPCPATDMLKTIVKDFDEDDCPKDLKTARNLLSNTTAP